MTLRKDHPDSHWCNALEKYIKAFIREFDVRLVADLTALAELRAKMECLHRELIAIPSARLSDHEEVEGASESDVARAVALAYEISSLATTAFGSGPWDGPRRRAAGSVAPRCYRSRVVTHSVPYWCCHVSWAVGGLWGGYCGAFWA